MAKKKTTKKKNKGGGAKRQGGRSMGRKLWKAMTDKAKAQGKTWSQLPYNDPARVAYRDWRAGKKVAAVTDEPAQPAEPAEPALPAEPADPALPADPAEPDDPDEPAVPSIPLSPVLENVTTTSVPLPNILFPSPSINVTLTS